MAEQLKNLSSTGASDKENDLRDVANRFLVMCGHYSESVESDSMRGVRAALREIDRVAPDKPHTLERLARLLQAGDGEMFAAGWMHLPLAQKIRLMSREEFENIQKSGPRPQDLFTQLDVVTRYQVCRQYGCDEQYARIELCANLGACSGRDQEAQLKAWLSQQMGGQPAGDRQFELLQATAGSMLTRLRKWSP
jgi:hypothetical protein